MFNFQHSQITQNEYDKLAKRLTKYSSVYATSKSDVGKVSSSLHLPLKPDAVFKKQRASKVPIHLHQEMCITFQSNKSTSTITTKTNNISLCQTLNLNQSINFLESQYHP